MHTKSGILYNMPLNFNGINFINDLKTLGFHDFDSNKKQNTQ